MNPAARTAQLKRAQATPRTWELSAEEKRTLPDRVLAVLREGRVQGRTITAEQIAQHPGVDLKDRAGRCNVGYTLDDRKVRMAIDVLVVERGELIAASNHKPMGYYLVQEPEEAEIYEAVLRSRALKILRRLKRFRENRVRKFSLVCQLVLWGLEAAIKELENGD